MITRLVHQPDAHAPSSSEGDDGSMVIWWWSRRRRRRKLLERPFPPQWRLLLERNVRHYLLLNDTERRKLEGIVQVFIAEKYWEGCHGLEITDEIKVTIAGHACLMLLGFDNHYFDTVMTILVYPDAYVATQTAHQPGGVVSESRDIRLGEAWFRGPVILAWSDVQTADNPDDDGLNVVIHEFAHVLDVEDLVFDGTPLLANTEQYKTWQQVMTAEYNLLVKRSARGRATLLDSYGATNEAEFFAVASECFFEQPVEMAKRHSRLYELLRTFYRQDPAGRVRG